MSAGATVLTGDDVPAWVRARSALGACEYADLMTVPAPGARRHPPRAWAEGVVRGTARIRLFGPVVWRGVLGLDRDHSPSGRALAGWRVGAQGEDWIRLDASSWLVSAEVLLLTAEERVSLATFVRYEHPAARAVWPPIGKGHRDVVPRLLRHAARTLGAV